MSKSVNAVPETPQVEGSLAPSKDAFAGAWDPVAPSVWLTLLKTLRHFFPHFSDWLKATPDPRDPRSTVYPIAYVLASGLLLFLTKLGSRRQMRFQFQTASFVRNLNVLCDTTCETMLHPDTLGVLAGRLSVEGLMDLRAAMVRRLVRSRCLEGDRLLQRWYRVAVDMTGHLVFRKRHCKHCLTQQHGETTVYYHPVLEAKLVTLCGLSISIATEFVENPDVGMSKQDCELKAFRRLAKRLKADYPQLRICLLMDGLYACGPVFEVCTENHWRFIITFKEGSAPAVFAEYERLKAAGVQPRSYELDDVRQTYTWVNGIHFSGHRVNVLECGEIRSDKEPCRFVWVTDLLVDETNHKELGNSGGRLRWKIENQGFNIQKNNGYELEHAYSEGGHALKNFYLLLQIAHFIAQLMEKGLLAKSLPKQIGGIRNVARLLLEELRRVDPDLPRLQEELARRIQIRFNDSS